MKSNQTAHPTKSWFIRQVEKAREELAQLPPWMRAVARFEGTEPDPKYPKEIPSE